MKDQEEISRSIFRHCKRLGLCQDEDTVIVIISRKKKPKPRRIKIDPSIWAQNPRELWLKDNADDKFLCTRVANCLNNFNVQTMYALVTKNEHELLQYRNLGERSMTRLKEWMAKYGLYFQMDIPDDVTERFSGKRNPV